MSDNIYSGVFDVEDVEDTNIKINPDFYIHNAILKAQQALLHPDMKEAHIRYSLFVEHIEMLCRAAKKIDTDYDSRIAQYKNDEEYKNSVDLIKQAKLANKKLGLIMDAVFDQKPMTIGNLELKNVNVEKPSNTATDEKVGL